MSTVASRTVRSSPYRDAAETWCVIVDRLCGVAAGAARAELLAVAGVAASVIADRAPQDAPVVVTCDGPRTRVHCIYDEDAVSGSDASEEPLGFDALKGDWRVSLPCIEEDLAWVQAALKKHSLRITARSLDAVVASVDSNGSAPQPLTIDPKGFLRR